MKIMLTGGRSMGGMLAALCFALGAIGEQAAGDVIRAGKADIECRILENSAQVLVLETVAGEYIVLDKGIIQSLESEAPEEFYYRRGKFYEGRSNDNRALLDFLEVINRNPNHANAKQAVEAIQYRQKKNEWDRQVESANAFAANNDYWQALTEYKKALDLQPEERTARQIVQRMSDVHSRLAFLYYDHCAEQYAIVELVKAEELNPENAEIYYVLARIHENNQKYEIARLEFERAIELNPNHISARNGLTRLIERTRGRSIR
ncbi:MAG: tetratricopeptide repeat protein [Candidatus Omnitrophota bacterium]